MTDLSEPQTESQDLLSADYITVPIDEIGPHPLNYNGHPDPQVTELGRSAMQFGQVKNIVVWQGKIIAGEGFWRGAKLIGMKSIDVKDVSHWPEARALAFMAVDNELAKRSQPDPFGLADIVRQAHEGGEDTPGISEAELAAILAGLQPPSLDELELENGQPEDETFWPVVKVRISPETKAKYDALMVLLPGKDEGEKFDAMVTQAQLTFET